MRLRLSLLSSLFAVTLAACGGRVSFGPDPDGHYDAGAVDAGLADDGGGFWDSGRPEGQDANTSCVATCADHVATPTTKFGSMAEVANAITGKWTLCSGQIVSPADAIGLEIDAAAGKGYFLVADASGKAVHGQGAEYELAVVIVDTTVMNGPGVYQINLSTRTGESHFFSSYSECPRALVLKNAMTGDEADYVADAPPRQDCSLVGTWEMTQSDLGAEAAFQFASDGSFIGGPAGATLPQEETFGGQYEMSADNVMTLVSSYGMGCGYSATYQATFDSSCNAVGLHELTDGCTGARKYLHFDQTLTRTK